MQKTRNKQSAGVAWRLVPNVLSMIRLAAAAIVPILLLWGAPIYLTVAVFIGASITDYLDGRLARRWGLTSKQGAALDLIADKALVCAVLIAMTSIGWAPVWVTIIVVVRELVITSLRSVVPEGTIPADWLGKLKTLLTMPVMAVILLAEGLGVHLVLFDVLLWPLVAVLTIASSVRYLCKALPFLMR